MTLVMFDIDGTLTETFEADSDCYVRALKDVFDFSNVDTDWSAYKHTSDSGILHELVECKLSRPVADSERVAFRARFVELLTEATSTSSNSFRPLPGVKKILQGLRQNPNRAVSLATGGWEISALLKLKLAGLDLGGLPAAFADDSPVREEIMNLSLRRALRHYGQDMFETIVYIGDGVWDLRAANKLGFQFIGIGSGERAEKLRAEGAELVFSDYSHEIAFFSALIPNSEIGFGNPPRSGGHRCLP